MEIRHLTTFKAIVELGSFIKAAKVLNYAQSSITSHIQAIESFYEQPVFDRLGKQIVLNSFGEKVYHKTIKLLEAYESVSKLKTDTDIPAGKLRISAPESILVYRISPILQLYKKKYPDVEIEIQNLTDQETGKAILNGELDLAFFLDRKISDSSFCVSELCEEKMSMALPLNYPGNQLISNPHYSVIYTLKGCSYREIFQNLLLKHGIQSENIIETGSVEVIKNYILCEIGISFLPTITIQKELDTGKIRHIPWQTDDPLMVQMVYHKDKWITPAMQEFIQLTKDHSKNW